MAANPEVGQKWRRNRQRRRRSEGHFIQTAFLNQLAQVERAVIEDSQVEVAFARGEFASA